MMMPIMGIMTDQEFLQAWRAAIAASLRMALASEGFSRAELARRTGINPRQLARWFDENDKEFRDIPVAVLYELAPHLDTTPEEIVAMARSVLEKQTSMTWGQHVLAAKRGHSEPDDQ